MPPKSAESMETHNRMGKPCDICGGVRNEDLTATCCQCGIDRHIYCMTILLWGVPNVWFCEECQPNNNAVSPKYCEKEVLTSKPEIAHRDATCPDHMRKVYNKRQKTGKVIRIPTEEAIMLTSGTNKMDIPSWKSWGKSSGWSTRMASTSKKTLPRTASIKLLSSKLESNTTVKPTRLLTPPKHFSVPHAAQASKKLKEAKTPVACTRNISSREQPNGSPKLAKECKTSDTKVEMVTDISRVSSPSMHDLPINISEAKTPVACTRNISSREQPNESPKLANECKTSDTKVEMATDISHVSSPSMHDLPINISGDKSCADAVIRIPVIEEKKLLSSRQTLQNYIPNLSRMKATWKGTFEILSSTTPGKVYDGFEAHPPPRVHLKVLEFSKQMPSVLQFKLLPRCNIWVDIFQDDCPDLDDIALYIIPEDPERSIQPYNVLVEAMEMHDSVMCSYMGGGVEFLIFTSKLLHKDFQKSITKKFLWGVFRHVKERAITEEHMEVIPLLAYDSHSEENYEVDMEIDMIGGNDV